MNYCLALLAIAAHPPLERYTAEQPHMGVPVRIVLFAPDPQTAKRGLERAFDRIAELDSILSDYGTTTELNRLSRQSPTPRPVPVSDDLWQVLQHAQRLSRATGGAFDVTVGPYSRLWRRARRQRKLPAPQRMSQAAKAVGFEHLQLHPDQQAVTLAVAQMKLDLGGVAKGYVADQALVTLRGLGLRRALVNASGDIALGDPPPDARGWRIGIAPLEQNAPPSRLLLLSNCGIATSGDLWQFVEIDGQRYSHILDPRTGMGILGRSSVTVVAPNCMTADALASAVTVLGPKAGTQLIERQRRAAALVVYRSAGQTRMKQSRHFQDLPALPAAGPEPTGPKRSPKAP